MLTELEGAILSEIHHRGNQTAFQVRRAFERSPSMEWSGSAGAIYPAVRRMTAAGLIRSQATGERRGTRRLSLTVAGVAELDAWTTDVSRSVTIGVDPFRLRLSLWEAMPRAEWRTLRGKLTAGLLASTKQLEDYIAQSDPVEHPGARMAIALNKVRLQWLQSL
ncbi:MAG TPA: PadR family transcriptional regulator [Hyphomonadaceae bacterium]|nr:PadR family transcriptional regulator [Hyphomonadaceae bacterium]